MAEEENLLADGRIRPLEKEGPMTAHTPGADPEGRRSFLFRSAVAGGLAVAGPLCALLANAEHGEGGRGRHHDDTPDYGPLIPVEDETTGLPLLLLPERFRYVSFGWTGDPLECGSATPGAHDGMAALRGHGHRTLLVRNHEVSSDTGVFAPHTPAYDPGGSGGTTTLEFDTRRGRLVRTWASLTGTRTNCAGGPTPWGSWLTCEETLAEPAPGTTGPLTRPHGYVFEVPSRGEATGQPLRAMGRFVHEAVAVDPRTGIVYLTEDRGTSGFYRFLPRHPGRLAAGGRLQMLGISGQPQYDTRTGQTQGEELKVDWYDIDDPDRAHHLPGDSLGVFRQGYDQGGALFARLEGAWYGDGTIYFVSTSGGNVGEGQVWAYQPRKRELSLVFESPNAAVLDSPDNITVSPRGGLVLCEDGSGLEFVHGLTTDGQIFRFAQNNVVLAGERNGISGDFTGSEFAGATYSPDGDWLFVNIQSPGITFAITGPWGRGAL
jgi:secreted PhoX family phosphatase